MDKKDEKDENNGYKRNEKDLDKKNEKDEKNLNYKNRKIGETDIKQIEKI